MRRWAGAALLTAAALACAAAVTPPGKSTTEARAELGRRLFYDADLSRDGTLSCASCHVQRHGFSDSVPTRAGVGDAAGRRNAPGLANVGGLSPLTWADPSQKMLEGQIATPVFGEHPVEMGMAGQAKEIVRRLEADACYRSMFAAAFPKSRGEITYPAAAKAIAAFERTLISRNAPFDRYRRGDAEALGVDGRTGAALFQAKGCASCHTGRNLTDERFHAVVGDIRDGDEGLFEKTGKEADRGAFRTPSLRNVSVTVPYLHDGSAPTLAAAILSHEKAAKGLTQDDIAALEAFLAGLTDEDFLKDPRFALPTRFCGRGRSN